MIPLSVASPEAARLETTTLEIPSDEHALPPGRYAFEEHYCALPDCDCRRVMFVVKYEGQDDARPQTVAYINHAFEPPSGERYGGAEPDEQTFLDPLHSQSEHAETLLEYVTGALDAASDWAENLEKHYRQFRRAVADPSHPAHERLVELGARQDRGLEALAQSIIAKAKKKKRSRSLARRPGERRRRRKRKKKS